MEKKIAHKMKSAILNAPGQSLQIREEDVPTPGSHEILVKMIVCGCCHSDLHVMKGDWPKESKIPVIPGHEGIGTVVQIGTGVTLFKVGDVVGLPWLARVCGSCEYCRTGRETLCLSQYNSGFNDDGCFRDYAIGYEFSAVHIPNSLDPIQAAPILCAGLTSYKAIKESDAKPGEFITIIGAAGGLGHLAIQYAKLMGLQVIAADLGEEKCATCKSLGVDLVVDIAKVKKDVLIETIERYSRGGSHAVICLATSTNAFENAVAVCRAGGTVVCVGLPSGSFNVPLFDLVLKRITIRGSIVGTLQDLREALDFAARGLVRCSISSILPLERINEVFDKMQQGAYSGRAVISFS